MDRTLLSIVVDSSYKESEIKNFLKDLVNIFDIEDRVYSLEKEEDKNPSIVISFGELNGENFSKVHNNINSDFWKSASKKLAKIISKYGKEQDSILIFECNYKKSRGRFTCRTKESKIVKAAMNSLENGLNFLIQIFKSGDIPSSEIQIYCGFDERDNEYKIDRAVTFTPEFQEYAYDETKNKWNKIKIEKD
ncbi:MAG: hypothetical protein NWE86_01105 [Candidatus Bathyarchaeota archaeon]|nr:hypothetical protein [Candidatus Bathyarchaeota archaeon]